MCQICLFSSFNLTDLRVLPFILWLWPSTKWSGIIRFWQAKKCVLYVFYKTQQWNYRKPKSMKISEWQRHSRLRIKKNIDNNRENRKKRMRKYTTKTTKDQKKSIVFIKDLDPSVWYKSIVTLNRFTIEAILHKSHEWKCVTHKIISMVVIIYVNQCQNSCSLLTLLHRIWMVWYRHHDKILSLLFLHRFFLLLLLSLPKWKQIWIYFTCQAQCKRAEINKTMQNDNRENDTRVSKCLSMVLCRHWFDAWQPVRRS